ncbi:MAG TPA: ATP-binding protein [Vicinamibacterales bacterium]|nr:ATP-binding protein [Vicinamibacterales bacterium]
MTSEHTTSDEPDYRALLESVHGIVWRADARTFQTTFVSKEAEEILGYPLSAWTRVPGFWAAHIHPDDRETALAFTARETRERRRHDFEYRMIAADGRSVWLRNIVTVISKDGEPAELVGVTVDTTARKQAEFEADDLRRELARVARASTLGEMAATLAHELNQPLGAIVSNAETAERLLTRKDAAARAELGSILGDIRRDGQRAGDIIHRIHAFLQRETVAHGRLDVGPLIDGVLRTMSSLLTSRKVTWSLDVAPSLPPVTGDAVQLQEVLANLVRNAVEAMADSRPSERTLIIRAAQRDTKRVELSVVDNGPGIRAAIMPRLFEPFATTKQGGIGMGLAISRRIVQAHGGGIRAENNPSGGATVSFTIPLYDLVGTTTP